MALISGIDVSYAQYYPNWSAAIGSGIPKFVYARATYGINPADDDGPVYVHNHDACIHRAVPFGAYTFWIAADDPVGQAQHFLQAIDGREGTAVPMVDVEGGSGVRGWGTIQQNIDALGAHLDVLQKALCQPLLYVEISTWNTYFGGTDAFSGHRLWVADPSDAPGQPTLPNGFKDWCIHQYGTIAVPGFSAPVDADVLKSDLSTILR